MNYFVRILLVNLCMVFALQVGAQSATNSKTKKHEKSIIRITGDISLFT